MAVVALDSSTYRGRVIDLRGRKVSASAVAAAIYRESDELSIACSSPSPIHQRVGWIREDRKYPIRAALAATARKLGHRSEYDDDIESVEQQLANLETDTVSIRDTQKQQAEIEPVDQLKEQIAELRGQIRERRQQNHSVTDQVEQLQTAAAELSERETQRVALQQQLIQQRKQLETIRDQREQRLQLQDRRKNLEKQARKQLAAELEPAFRRALNAVPGEYELGEKPGSVVAGSTTAALAVCRIAPLNTPVIIESDRFSQPVAASAAVNNPVIMV